MFNFIAAACGLAAGIGLTILFNTLLGSKRKNDILAAAREEAEAIKKEKLFQAKERLSVRR